MVTNIDYLIAEVINKITVIDDIDHMLARIVDDDEGRPRKGYLHLSLEQKDKDDEVKQ